MISGLIYIPNYLSASEQADLIQEIDSEAWSNELKRRVQHYGYKYDYTKKSINDSMIVGPMPSFCQKLAAKLVSDKIFVALPDQLIVNEYVAGQGIAPHIDCVPCFNETIVSISLLDEYPMTFTCDSEKIDLGLGIGSLVSLTGDARYKWRHSIAARKSDGGRLRGRRVSLTFRNVILNG